MPQNAMGGGGPVSKDQLEAFIEAQNLKATTPLPSNIVGLDTPYQEIDSPSQETREAAFSESPPKGTFLVSTYALMVSTSLNLLLFWHIYDICLT